ncbi:MAG: lactate utilization protein C [Anaerolineae bacterium]|nr:lactate utilization protein C [Anaerolineae bacterium]
MSEARAQILERLRARQADATDPGAWTTRRDFPDLVSRFSTALEAARGEVFIEDDLAAAVVRLERLLHNLGAQRVVANPEPPLDTLDLPVRFPDYAWHVAGENREALRQFCSEADAGLSSAQAALAETGTVIVDNADGRSRLVTLLPPVHIVLLPASRLTSDIFTWTAARSGPLPPNVTLISGPSKTADIEQTLAVGVHGPRRLSVIVYR